MMSENTEGRAAKAETLTETRVRNENIGEIEEGVWTGKSPLNVTTVETTVQTEAVTEDPNSIIGVKRKCFSAAEIDFNLIAHLLNHSDNLPERTKKNPLVYYFPRRGKVKVGLYK